MQRLPAILSLINPSQPVKPYFVAHSALFEPLLFMLATAQQVFAKPRTLATGQPDLKLRRNR
jgi:hypothetical protein